jgi:hypothetical protein
MKEDEKFDALVRILETARDVVITWVDEGFTTPPYPEEYYDLFEFLGITNEDVTQYDVARPGPED